MREPRVRACRAAVCRGSPCSKIVDRHARWPRRPDSGHERTHCRFGSDATSRNFTNTKRHKFSEFVQKVIACSASNCLFGLGGMRPSSLGARLGAPLPPALASYSPSSARRARLGASCSVRRAREIRPRPSEMRYEGLALMYMLLSYPRLPVTQHH